MKHMAVKRNWLGLILALVMFLSGMCSAGRVDSELVGPKTPFARILKAESFTITNHVNAEEISAVRTLVRITLGFKRNLEKFDIEIRPAFIFVTLWPENTPYFTRMGGLQAEKCAPLKNAVIHYIHRKDGEKDTPIV